MLVTIFLNSQYPCTLLLQLGMTTMDDEPANQSIISDDAWLEDEETRRDTLYYVAAKVVDTFVDLETDFDANR